MRELFRQLGQNLKNNKDAVLVTVVASSGSTPRGAGARMLVTEAGRLHGTIGGGAVEYRSEKMAQEVLQKKCSHIEHFRLYRNEVEDLGMICGGNVDVYFQYIPAGDKATISLTETVEQLFKEGEQSWLISEITEGAGGALGVFGKRCGAAGMKLPEEVIDSLDNHPRVLTVNGKKYYCELLVRAGRVFICGGGHVAQELVPVLARVNFRCVVLEDRPDFARPELFPGVEETRLVDFACLNDYVTITEDDYVCIMTRGHTNDRLAQAQVLKTPACYIGVIGSAKKTAGVFAVLKEEGFTDEDFKRITTPIGLDISAETPAEIAVSIAAQLIKKRAELASRKENINRQSQ
ncbi:MAG: XdhC family protein [Peptococcaceae bacterium]|nr:XdhC family protein [Peptococcaceae bacterium]